jgi:phenylacetic acid degradation protein paaN
MTLPAGARAESPAARFLDDHRETLRQALTAISERGYWSAFPESPSPRVYGEGAAEAGRAAYEAHLGRRFELDQAGTVGWVGAERSPYGPELGVSYPQADLDALLASARAGMPAWRDAGPEVRAAVCVEIVRRVNARSFEIANAVMHTSGQAFVMAFQAGGPHAQDRALEAVAYAYAEQTRVPATARWEKPQGKRPPLVMEKTYTVVPRGIGLVVGCVTFPTWNSYPGLFASLATGNAVVVKPHPAATLPLAITVSIARDVLGEAGFARDLVTLVAEEPGGRAAAELAVRPEVRIVDFTGSTAFGQWLEDNARQAAVYTEKAGVNAVLLDSTDDYAGMLANLAFSLCLYSGQMCTTPQDLLVPADGIGTDAGRKSVAELAADLGAAIDKLLGADAQAVELLGAIVNDDVLSRLESASSGSLGEVVVPSRAVTHPAYPDARIRTPVVVRVSADEPEVWGSECFGPVAFLVTTESTDFGLELFRRTASARGALTASVYSTDEKVVAAAREAALDAGVALSENLTGGVYVNQSAAFSDFHATGANPAANAAYTDAHFVAGRFRVVQSRRHLPAG